jgi:hypothetical protein
MAEAAREGLPPLDSPRAPQEGTEAWPLLARGVRLRMYESDSGHPRMRWVSLNGHPGRCAAEHRHVTPEAALSCFQGRSRTSTKARTPGPHSPDVVA